MIAREAHIMFICFVFVVLFVADIPLWLCASA
jgi:hypothetical protein